MSSPSEGVQNGPDLATDYRMNAAQVGALVTQLFLEHPPVGDSQSVCYEFNGNDRFANIGRYVEVEVFQNAFANDAAVFEENYGPYDAASSFFVSFDCSSQQPTGVLRVIKNSSHGLKTLNDIESPDILGLSKEQVMLAHDISTLDAIWDVGTVGVRKQLPATINNVEIRTSLQLYRALYVSAADKQRGADHLISVIDHKALQQLTKYLGIPFKPLYGSSDFTYLGSASSRAVYGHVPDFYRTMNRRRRLFKLATSGRVSTDGQLSQLVKALDQLMDGTDGMDESLQFLYKS